MAQSAHSAVSRRRLYVRIALGLGISLALLSTVDSPSARTVHAQPMAVSTANPCAAVGMFWVCGTYRSEATCARALADAGGTLVSPMGDRIRLSCLRAGERWKLEGPMT